MAASAAPGDNGILGLSKKSMDFFDKKVALRYAPQLSAFGGQFDARFAISIFVHAHVA
jgi:hypothetical protein